MALSCRATYHIFVLGKGWNDIGLKVQLLNDINFMPAIRKILQITLIIFLEIKTLAGRNCRLYKIISLARRYTYWPRVAQITLYCIRETFFVLLTVWNEPLPRQNIWDGGSFDKLLQWLTSQEKNVKWNHKHMPKNLQ